MFAVWPVEELMHESPTPFTLSVVCTSQVFVVTFNALALLVWQQKEKKPEWWGVGMVICLQRGAD